MSMLRSALDELRSDDLRDASDQQLEDDLAELERASRVLEAEQARRLAEVERRGSWAVDGHLSVVSWFAGRLRMSFGRASAHVRLARALQQMPATSRAFAEAELSSEAVGLLVRARDTAPDAFDEAEEMLVEAARSLPVRELRSAVAYWQHAADAAGSEERARRIYEGRHLHVSPTLDGTVRLDGDLDPESGETVIVALRSVQDAWAREGGEDRRTATQRRADALTEVCRTFLDRVDRPAVGGERPHVVVTADVQTLEGRAGRSALDDVGPITPEAARRLACDAKVARVITEGASRPLDVGRSTPVVPAGLRRALLVRDRGCRFPGCGRPHRWCDAHHVRHWSDGGRTALDNLVLLCRPHHRAVHEDFRVEIEDGRPRFDRADGRPLAERAPP